MAQSNFEERIDTYEIESTNVMTGDRDRSRYLYYQLKMSMAKAKRIDIIVSFLMESGVRMLLNDMKRALERGVKIRILTGNYLGITQPSALYLIKSELGDHVDLRLYNETSRSFHPKSYIFHYESSNEIYIGSSNISKSALTSGIEWNYRFSDTLDKKNYELFYATFEDLFLNHSILIDDEELKRYSKAWKKPAVSRDLAKYDATEDGEDRNAENVRMLYRPRGAQIEALYALQESRMEENIIVELKAPKVPLSKIVLRQIEDYMDFIRKQPGYNSEFRQWKFIAVCKEVDEDIKSRYDAFKDKGKIGLVFQVENYEIYAYTWDDVFKSFELRHAPLLKRLKYDQEQLVKELLKEVAESEEREKVNELTDIALKSLKNVN